MTRRTEDFKIQPFVISWFPVLVMCFESFCIGEIGLLYSAQLTEVYFKISPCRAWRSFPILDGILYTASPTNVIAISAHIPMTMYLIECFRVDVL
jgi:hypothetical protein